MDDAVDTAVDGSDDVDGVLTPLFSPTWGEVNIARATNRRPAAPATRQLAAFMDKASSSEPRPSDRDGRHRDTELVGVCLWMESRIRERVSVYSLL